MTTYIITFLIINLINAIASEDCIIDNRTPENSWEQQLDKHLRYDINIVRPSFNTSLKINVRIQFILKYFSYDAIEDVFSIQTWLFMSWSDSRLEWKPEDFHGIKETIASEVWVPSLRLFDSDIEDIEYFSSMPCNIKSNGRVKCVIKRQHFVTCKIKMGNWPYNLQKCVMSFGTWPEWIEKGVNVTLSFRSKAVSLAGAEEGVEWKIIDYEQEENRNSEVQLRMIFTLERKPSVITAIIIYPSLLVTLLTLICLFLDVRNNIRLALIGLSLAVHFECLTEVGEYMPSNTADPPSILLYLRGSVILTVISGLLTLFLSSLCKKETTPFQWISRFNSLALQGFVRFLFWPQWTEDDTTSNDVKFSVEWMNLSCILNRICTLVIILVYACLYFAFMPRPMAIEKSQF